MISLLTSTFPVPSFSLHYKMWLCYLISSQRCTYVGVTLGMHTRLRQHNGEIKGGAKATSRLTNWKVVCTIHGFPNRSVVQKFESRVKRFRRRCGGRGGVLQGAQIMWNHFLSILQQLPDLQLSWGPALYQYPQRSQVQEFLTQCVMDVSF